MRIVRYLKLFKVSCALAIKKCITYRESFILQFFAQGLNYGATFLLMYITVHSFGNINGWETYEIMLLYTISLMAYALAGFVFYFFNYITVQDVLSGAFDDTLTKPLPPMLYMIYKTLTPGYITHFFCHWLCLSFV